MTSESKNLHCTLEQLENDKWDEPGFDSDLVKRTYALRKVPLNKFAVEDLRIMIGQGFGLEYLIPLALDTLSKDIFAEGDLYPGDLLQATLKIDKQFWNKHSDLWQKLDSLLQQFNEQLARKKINMSDFHSVELRKK
jgi:hypothetical protein